MKARIIEATSSNTLELYINEWLEENPDINIKFMQASQAKAKSQYGSDSTTTVYIFYDKPSNNISLNS